MTYNKLSFSFPFEGEGYQVISDGAQVMLTDPAGNEITGDTSAVRVEVNCACPSWGTPDV